MKFDNFFHFIILLFKICQIRTAQDLNGEKGRKEKIFQNPSSGQFLFLKVVTGKV